MWHPCRIDCNALDVDGSYLSGVGITDFGGIFQTRESLWINEFSGYLDDSNNTHVELSAILHRIKLATRQNFKNVVCYSDSLHVLILIANTNIRFPCYVVEIRSIYL